MPVEGLALHGLAELFSFTGHTLELRQSLLALGTLIITAKLAEGVRISGGTQRLKELAENLTR